MKDISAGAGLPLATTYRHVNDLAGAGLLVVERSAMTEDGKRYEMYRSTVRSIKLELDGEGHRVVWELNDALEDRLARMWSGMRRLG